MKQQVSIQHDQYSILNFSEILFLFVFLCNRVLFVVVSVFWVFFCGH